VRVDGEKAALLWAERMRLGRPREDANLRERAEMGLERRPYRANSGRTITPRGSRAKLEFNPKLGAFTLAEPLCGADLSPRLGLSSHQPAEPGVIFSF